MKRAFRLFDILFLVCLTKQVHVVFSFSTSTILPSTSSPSSINPSSTSSSRLKKSSSPPIHTKCKCELHCTPTSFSSSEEESYVFPPADSNNDREDPRSNHPFLADVPDGDMDVIFLGTASCVPSTTRGVSCTALRLGWRTVPQVSLSSSTTEPNSLKVSVSKAPPPASGIWLFDAGEGSQLQLQYTNKVRAGKITKIFITHCHGDHSFGLPGLLCMLGMDRQRDAPPIDIYGPEGLRSWLRHTIRYTTSRITPNYRVHELKDVPLAPAWQQAAGVHSKVGGKYFNSHVRSYSRAADKHESYSSFLDSLIKTSKVSYTANNTVFTKNDASSYVSHCRKFPDALLPDTRFGEVPGGLDIHPEPEHALSFNCAPVWNIITEGDVKVYASVMSHGVPCVGYVCEENGKPGRLKSEIALPVLRRNFNALRSKGVSDPMKMMTILKQMQKGESLKFPDGTVLTAEDVLEQKRKGRKVVICGDTCDASSLTNLARDADIVIHEATNAYLKGDREVGNAFDVQLETLMHGHSTPQMAGEFAKRVGAKRLILNHFSPRYKGDSAVDSRHRMAMIEELAMDASGLNETDVVCAWDYLSVSVPPEHKRKKAE